jgi:hypothetical protein
MFVSYLRAKLHVTNMIMMLMNRPRFCDHQLLQSILGVQLLPLRR